MMHTNPMHLSPDIPQKIQWKMLKHGVYYKFELIIPARASIHQFEDRGAYLAVLAECQMDNDLVVGKVLKGDLVLIHFPLKTYESAWLGQGVLFRRQYKLEDNLEIKFVKESRQSLIFYDAQIRPPSQEQIISADKNYGPVPITTETIKREVEEL